MLLIPAGKRLVQTLISDVAKKMRMSSNVAKRKREEDEKPTGRMIGRGNCTLIPVTNIVLGKWPASA